MEANKPLFGAIALAVFTWGCASSGATPRPFPIPSARSAEPRDTNDSDKDKDVSNKDTWAKDTSAKDTSPKDARSRDQVDIVRTALNLQGVPYRNGGQAPDGFDCSGFTQFVFGTHGVFLPREVIEQFRVGRSVTPTDIAPGDLIFFATVGGRPSHVAIAVDGDNFVHAPSSKGVVRIEQLGSSYWAQRLVGVRRMMSDD